MTGERGYMLWRREMTYQESVALRALHGHTVRFQPTVAHLGDFGHWLQGKRLEETNRGAA